jgi:hypothetical protein
MTRNSEDTAIICPRLATKSDARTARAVSNLSDMSARNSLNHNLPSCPATIPKGNRIRRRIGYWSRCVGCDPRDIIAVRFDEPESATISGNPLRPGAGIVIIGLLNV